MMFLYIIGVLACLGLLYVWTIGTNYNTFGVTPEEMLVYKITCVCTILPVLNLMAGTLLGWHILKRQGRI